MLVQLLRPDPRRGRSCRGCPRPPRTPAGRRRSHRGREPRPTCRVGPERAISEATQMTDDTEAAADRAAIAARQAVKAEPRSSILAPLVVVGSGDSLRCFPLPGGERATGSAHDADACAARAGAGRQRHDDDTRSHAAIENSRTARAKLGCSGALQPPANAWRYPGEESCASRALTDL